MTDEISFVKNGVIRVVKYLQTVVILYTFKFLT